MSTVAGRQPLSSMLLAAFGFILAAVGAYFIFLRPALLPEDLRYLGVSLAQINGTMPNLPAWLSQVFRVLGGYMLAAGILTIFVARSSYREHVPGAAIAALLAGAASIGVMTLVNFAIDSDFKWLLAAVAAVWLGSISLHLLEVARGLSTRKDRREAATVNAVTAPERRSYPFSYSASVRLDAKPEDVFAFADDFSRLSAHMKKSSGMMMGSSMAIALDAGRGQQVGSHVQMSGTMLGLKLFLDEAITRREPPRLKEWETVGTSQLIVIGGYRLGYRIDSQGGASDLTVHIDYDLPASPGLRIVGHFFGGLYAKWCVDQMISSARTHFGPHREI